jgi:hypothetical protein
MKIEPWSDKEVVFDEEKHLYLVDGQPKCGPNQLMQMVGLSKPVDDMPEPMRSNFLAAGNLGKVVHKWCEIYDKGDYDKYEAPLDKESNYIKSWISFRNDYKPDIIEIEKPRYSKYGDYCGIPDRVVIIENAPYIIDIKTSKSINPNSRLQTMAYTYFFKENMKRIIVQLKDNETYKVHELTEDAIDKNNWEAVLRVSNLIRIHNKNKE